MNTRRLFSSRDGGLGVFLILSILFNSAAAISKVVTHYCYEVTGNADAIKIETRILINDDPVSKVYAFDAASGDTSKTDDRTTDTDCIKDAATISDKYTDPLVYNFNVITTDSTHKCGVSVETDADGIVIVKFVFRIYAHSDGINTNDDVSYEAVCRKDDLTGAAVSTGQLGALPRGNILRQQHSVGAYLRVRDSETLEPVVVAKVGDKIFLSIEFYPNLQLGPDNYGTHFFIGFLGIDPISGTTASELYIILIPRYSFRTDISVVTKYGEEIYTIEDGTPQKIILPSDLMGCSDGGVSEIQEKGVEINSYTMEIAVLVCSKETGTADCYTALPVDVTGQDYITTSMYVADDSSEFMIIGQEDSTSVTINIPASLGHTVTENGTATAAGGDLTISLNQRMAFHLAQTSAVAAQSTVNGYHITSDKPVSVITGNRKYSDDHLMEQVPPTTKFGDHYVLVPADLNSANIATTYIIQAVTSGVTTVTRYLSSTTSDTHTVTYGEYLPIDVASNTPCELTADKPIMVTQVVNDPTNTGFPPTMVVMPAVTQWAPKYSFYHPDYPMSVLVVFKAESDKDSYRVDGVTITPQLTAQVEGPNGFFYGAHSVGSGGIRTFSMAETAATTAFMVIGYLSDGSGASNIGTAVLGWGYRYSDKDQCLKVGRINDQLDNDCDGLIDEEIANGEDDDGDGVPDEDLAGSTDEYAGAVAVRPVNCKVSADISFAEASKTHQITGTDGCALSGSSLFRMASEFQPQTGDNIGTGTKPKITNGGDIVVSQYINEPRLYFKCDIEKYCYSADDTDCTVICSGALTRRKRTEDEEQKVKNITSNIWVFPYDTGKSKPAITETKQVTTLAACLDNTYVQVSFALLGMLAMVCFLTAICFCCLFRRRNKNEKEKEKTKTTYYNGYKSWF